MKAHEAITIALTLAQGDFSRINQKLESKRYEHLSVLTGVGVFNMEDSMFYPSPIFKMAELKQQAESFIYSQLEFYDEKAEQQVIDTGIARGYAETSIIIGDYAELEYLIYVSKYIPPYEPDPTEQEDIEFDNSIESTKLITGTKTYEL